MLSDLEFRSCSRSCAESGRDLQAGEVYFSVLVEEDNETVRRDFSAEVWAKPPEGNLGWWRSRVPTKNEKPKLAPNEVMLNLFASLAEKPEESQFRYVLGLLLIRRKQLRREDVTIKTDGNEVLLVFSPKREEQYELVVDEPDPEHAEAIQQRMIELLYDNTVPDNSVTENTAPSNDSTAETEAA